MLVAAAFCQNFVEAGTPDAFLATTEKSYSWRRRNSLICSLPVAPARGARLLIDSSHGFSR